MMRRHHRRGSVLLFVIVLAVILGMLGSAFLLVARLNRRESAALASYGQVEPMARGLVEQVRDQLWKDLYFDTSSSTSLPYSDLPSGKTEAAYAYMDYPSEAAGSDPWLCSVFTSGMTDWIHVSNIYDEGASDDGDYEDISVTSTALVDIDQRTDERDGPLVALGVVDPSTGQEFHAAVQVLDLLAFMNVNTAAFPPNSGEIAGFPAFSTPINYDLRGLLGSTILNLVNSGRFPGGTVSEFYTNSVSRLLNPDQTTRIYNPFGVGDEAYFRWLGSTPMDGRFKASVHDQAGGAMDADVRRFLTATSTSRSLLRMPTSDRRQRIPLGQLATILNNNTSNGRTNLYQFLCDLLGPTPNDKQAAAHLMVNLWAFLDGGRQSRTYAYTPSDLNGAKALTAYGVVRQPFLVEAFAKVEQNPTPPGGLNRRFDAIEIYNPYSVDVSGSGYTYKLRCGGNERDLGDLDDGDESAGRITIYRYDNPDAGFLDTTNDISGVKLEWTSLNLNNPVQLIRSVDAGGVEIVVDEIELASYPSVVAAGGGTDSSLTQRDDSNRARFAVNVTESVSTGASHSLGGANSVSAADIDCLGGFYIPVCSGSGVRDVGELLQLHITGPGLEGSGGTQVSVGLPEKLATYATRIDRGRFTVTASAQMASGNDYPSGPMGVFLGELFELLTLDASRETDNRLRTYGRINVNTAPVEVLKGLPMVVPTNDATLTLSGWQADGSTTNATVTLDYATDSDSDGIPDMTENAAKWLAAYRDGGTYGAKSFSSTPFCTPGQVAMALGDFLDEIIKNTVGAGNLLAVQRAPNYLYARELLYRNISNLITVNSDTYAVLIRLQIGDATGHIGEADGPEKAWRYLAVIDRSNCMKPADRPAILLMTKLP